MRTCAMDKSDFGNQICNSECVQLVSYKFFGSSTINLGHPRNFIGRASCLHSKCGTRGTKKNPLFSLSERMTHVDSNWP
uniref:Uncharacterized protein n=1 Tax=Rhizophora mucronata TaxID=61149 RepID=A0A2P2L184_RHIMU